MLPSDDEYENDRLTGKFLGRLTNLVREIKKSGLLERNEVLEHIRTVWEED